MKKVFLSLGTAALLAIGLQEAAAQTPYRTAIGIGIDVGDGPTLVGPQIKHSFGGANAGNAQVLFGDDVITLGVDYSYNKQIPGTNGLGWYVGIGPQLSFVDHSSRWFSHDDETYFAIRPAAGLEYKIPTAPIGFHFDWKPWWNLTHNSNFEPARFTLGFKFTIN
ncbi:hypothetical protein PQ465_13000 [Sphingobacterium oryzagri]|uniref:Outer membrane protein beta-barrel domain-containing protein n=1 Tax=Sphingobacterium oryzagri TaxID=3025669 RepID=A0ABY7WC28_9SPHI|nr:hypothetical protein [Sphingobacterium sp. KACC 22765]WDF67222.1 hypothetical protein PQ465_13000 [Sphingobacterium sp. KACC 22765]